jgi:ABC-type multidrug transport system fused ATPase/permease subunit
VITRRSFAARSQFGAQAELRRTILTRYQVQPLGWMQTHQTGDLVARAGVDAEAAVEVIAPLPYSTGVVLLLVVSTVALILTDVVLGLCASRSPSSSASTSSISGASTVPPSTRDQLGDLTTMVHEASRNHGGEGARAERFEVDD